MNSFKNPIIYLFVFFFFGCKDQQSVAMPFLMVETTQVSFSAEKNFSIIPCSSHTAIEAVSSQPEWCTAEVVTFKNGSAIEVNVLKNTAVEERMATVIVSAGAAKSVYVEVKQASAINKFTIQDINAWVDYPASDFIVKFNIAEVPLSYQYDHTKITVDASNRTVTALAEGTFIVTASAAPNLNTSFKVICSAVDKSDILFTSIPNVGNVTGYKTKWSNDGGGNNSTLFIGDSFFNPGNHWTNFYTAAYFGYDAFCFGLSSSTSYNWEILEGAFVTPLNPKNLVIHIGSNNFHHQKKTTAETNIALQRLFTLLHGKMPNAKIYWFGIPLRADTTYWEVTNQTNNAMQNWCDDREWITYIDTPSQITTSMYKDGAHLRLEHYSVLINALEATDIVIVRK